jgi:hypothetical protein
MNSYWAYKNAWSMDGLPGMKRGTVAAKKYSVAPSKWLLLVDLAKATSCLIYY